MKVLEERKTTHGDYEDVAHTSQKFKRMFRDTLNWEWMDSEQTEALEMISMKLARILCGNPSEKDHWEDIAGYAMLVYNSLEKAEEDSEDEVDRIFRIKLKFKDKGAA